MIDTLKAVEPLDPEAPVLVAGEPERQSHAERNADGIPIDAELRQQVRDIASAAGVPYLLG